MIGVISGSCPRQGRHDFAVAVRDQDEPGTPPDLGGRVDGQTRPVVPVISAIEHDRHAGGPQPDPSVRVVRFNSINCHI
jgi:hypothetical protein